MGNCPSAILPFKIMAGKRKGITEKCPRISANINSRTHRREESCKINLKVAQASCLLLLLKCLSILGSFKNTKRITNKDTTDNAPNDVCHENLLAKKSPLGTPKIEAKAKEDIVMPIAAPLLLISIASLTMVRDNAPITPVKIPVKVLANTNIK